MIISGANAPSTASMFPLRSTFRRHRAPWDAEYSPLG
jgi:hypothetical protein